MSNAAPEIGRLWECFGTFEAAAEKFSQYYGQNAHRVELSRSIRQEDFDLIIQAPMTDENTVNPVFGRIVAPHEWMNYKRYESKFKSPFAAAPKPKFSLGQAVRGTYMDGTVIGIRQSIYAEAPTNFVIEYQVGFCEDKILWMPEERLKAV